MKSDVQKRRFLTMDDLRAEYVKWSDDTIRRRVKDEGFPAIQDSGGLLFDRKEVELWFKRRAVKAG